MPTLMETTLKFDCTRLEEQVLLNKEKDVQLDTRVTALEGKETPVYTPMDLDLNTGIVAVTYDTTDGISLTTQGTIKSNTGTNDVVVDYEIPIVAGNNILIDKKADEDKIEVKLDTTQDITIKNTDIREGYRQFIVDASRTGNFSEGALVTKYTYGSIISTTPGNNAWTLTLPANYEECEPGNYTLLSTGNVKTLFGNQSIHGSGNIDLYRHNIRISGSSVPYSDIMARVVIISSKNLVVDSLTDLKTLLGDTFVYPATGYDPYSGANTGFVYQITESYVISSTGRVSMANMTDITDTVTTV